MGYPEGLGKAKGETMLPHERKLLTDRQLREASRDQIEDLVQRLNLILQERGEPGQLVWSLKPEYPARDRPTL
jgi:hypothetical protein